MILIYSDEINNRLQYISKIIFNQLLGLEPNFTTSRKEFISSELPKFNYSDEKFDNELYIKPHKLLFMSALITPTIQTVRFEGNKYFCESSKDSDFPFDPLAASFYLVTRYEEYFETARDNRGRFPAEKSILYKNDLLEKPVVNIWANMIGEKLKEKYPNIQLKKNKFDYLCSVDIDNAYAYKHKNIFRKTASSLKEFFTGNLSQLQNRFQVATKNKKDPFDTYDYMDKIFTGYEDKVRFFALLGDYGPNDKNISYKNRHYRSLLNRLSVKYRLGIHPSYQSSTRRYYVKLFEEVRRFEEITGRKPEGSRQHFLRLYFPKSYRNLIKAGVLKDYTMGYSSQPGFRAGICTPYYYYDLKTEKETKLKVIPFTIMDGTMLYYLNLTPDEAIERSLKLMKVVKDVGGTFVAVWHNESINDYGRWEGYQKVFEKMNEQGFKWADEQ